MQVKKQQLEPDLKQRTGSKSGKEYVKAVYCHPAYLIYMQNTSFEMPGWMKEREISITSDADDTFLMAESKEVKRLLMKVKEESEKVGLKLNIQKNEFMASVPSLDCKQMAKQWKQWQTLFCGAPKSLQMVIAAMKLKDFCSLKEKLWPT